MSGSSECGPASSAASALPAALLAAVFEYLPVCAVRHLALSRHWWSVCCSGDDSRWLWRQWFVARYAEESEQEAAGSDDPQLEWREQLRRREQTRRWAAASLGGGGCPSPPRLLFRTPPCSSVTSARHDLHTLLLCYGCGLRVCSLSSGRQLRQISRAHTALITCCEVSSTHHLAVTGGRDCSLRWLDLESDGVRVNARRSSHSASVTCVSWLHESEAQSLVSAALDAACKLWDTETGSCASTHNADDAASLGLLLSLSPLPRAGGPLLVTGSSRRGEAGLGEGRVALWDLRAKCGVVQAVTAERCGLITAVSCCDSTQALAAAGSDGLIRLYDLRRLGGNCRTVSALHSPISCRSGLQAHAGVMQSLSLTAERLLSCQPDAVTAFSMASGDSRRLPFAFPVHSLRAEEALQALNPAASEVAAPVPAVPGSAPGSACFSALSCSGEVLSLCLQQAVVVYNAQQALTQQGFAVSPPRVSNSHNSKRGQTGGRRRGA